eukprot:4960694-Alexandrium_andersonii.AAC.1
MDQARARPQAPPVGQGEFSRPRTPPAGASGTRCRPPRTSGSSGLTREATAPPTRAVGAPEREPTR